MNELQSHHKFALKVVIDELNSAGRTHTANNLKEILAMGEGKPKEGVGGEVKALEAGAIAYRGFTVRPEFDGPGSGWFAIHGPTGRILHRILASSFKPSLAWIDDCLGSNP